MKQKKHWTERVLEDLLTPKDTEEMGEDLTNELKLDPPTPATQGPRDVVLPGNWPNTTIEEIKQVLDKESHRQGFPV